MTEVELEYSCSYDSGPEELCMYFFGVQLSIKFVLVHSILWDIPDFVIIIPVGDSMFAIDLARFTPGRHSLVVTISSVFGQDLIVPTLPFVIPGIYVA